MKRILFALLAVSMCLVLGTRSSHADITVINGYCFASPDNRLVPCTSPTPVLDQAALAVTKDLSVSGGFAGPDGTTQYFLTITSQMGCFSLSEPVYLYAMGSPSAAALNELLPVQRGSDGSQMQVVFGQDNGTMSAGVATVSLEVANKYVGPAGVYLKAYWPAEGVERVITIVKPMDTATPIPGTATSTPTPAATATESPTPVSTGTPSPTPTATVPTGPVSVQTCVDPPILQGTTQGGDLPTLRGLTAPGAVCTGSVLYLDGTRPSSFDGTAQTADAQGLVAFPWKEDSASQGGIARVQCSASSGPITTSCTGFLILQSGDAGLSTRDQQSLLAEIQGLVTDPATCNRYFGS